MEFLAPAFVMYRPQPPDSVVWLFGVELLWIAFLVWPLLAIRRRFRIKAAQRGFAESILRLLEKTSRFEQDRNFENLGQMRAAAANSIHFWECLKEVDEEAVPDEAWVTYLKWIRQQERRWRNGRSI